MIIKARSDPVNSGNEKPSLAVGEHLSRGSYATSVSQEFSHGAEIRAEEVAPHQKFLDVGAAACRRGRRQRSGGTPVATRCERARKRWLTANKRFVRGG
jgi:hypothetical protein